jgi:hypothetical protein
MAHWYRKSEDGRPPQTTLKAPPAESLDAELAQLTNAQLLAVLDCLRSEALQAPTNADREYARMGFAVVRAELLSREFID